MLSGPILIPHPAIKISFSRKVQIMVLAFGSTINLSNNTKGGMSSDPHIVVSVSRTNNSMNDVYITWPNKIDDNQDIFFKKKYR